MKCLPTKISRDIPQLDYIIKIKWLRNLTVRNFDSMYQFLQDYLDDHPDAKMNNMLLLRGKKTNKHNAKLLETLRTSKKLLKPKFLKEKPLRKENVNHP